MVIGHNLPVCHRLTKVIIRAHLDLLSISQSGGKNVKTFRWDHYQEYPVAFGQKREKVGVGQSGYIRFWPKSTGSSRFWPLPQIFCQCVVYFLLFLPKTRRVVLNNQSFPEFKKNLNASKPSEHPPQVEECLKV